MTTEDETKTEDVAKPTSKKTKKKSSSAGDTSDHKKKTKHKESNDSLITVPKAEPDEERRSMRVLG